MSKIYSENEIDNIMKQGFPSYSKNAEITASTLEHFATKFGSNTVLLNLTQKSALSKSKLISLNSFA